MPPTPTERSLSPSDAELSSPEVAVRYAVDDDSEEEISENGQEVDDLNTLVRVQPLCFHTDIFCRNNNNNNYHCDNDADDNGGNWEKRPNLRATFETFLGCLLCRFLFSLDTMPSSNLEYWSFARKRGRLQNAQTNLTFTGPVALLGGRQAAPP